MATSTFDRKIVISDPKSIEKLIEIMNREAPKEPISDHPYTEAERERVDQLLQQCLSRSKH